MYLYRALLGEVKFPPSEQARAAIEARRKQPNANDAISLRLRSKVKNLTEGRTLRIEDVATYRKEPNWKPASPEPTNYEDFLPSLESLIAEERAEMEKVRFARKTRAKKRQAKTEFQDPFPWSKINTQEEILANRESVVDEEILAKDTKLSHGEDIVTTARRNTEKKATASAT